MKITNPEYVIEWADYAETINPEDSNLDVHISFKNGARFVATFITVQNIISLMSKYKLTGECKNGTYFWTEHMVIIETLLPNTIFDTIEDLMKNGVFERVFDGPYFDSSKV